MIGTKFVLYRQSHRKDKKDKIVLVEGKKRKAYPRGSHKNRIVSEERQQEGLKRKKG